MNLFSIHKQHKRKIVLLMIFAAILCALSCKETTPPMSEFQFVAEIPLDNVARGMLFVVDSHLYVLHHTSDKYYMNIIEQYNISNPVKPILENATYLSIPIYSFSYVASHRYQAFFYDHYQLIGLNFGTLEPHSQSVDFQVYDLVCNDQYLFLNTNAGLRIWDIANWPEYTEVFCDNTNRNNGQIALFDTILFEICRQEPEIKYAFWNVSNANDPFLVSEGYWHQDVRDVAMNDNYIIYATSSVIYRYQYDSCDTLILVESANIEQIYEHILSDSLIYLRHSSDFTTVALEDFADCTRTTLETGLPSGQYILRLSVHGNYVFVLIQYYGIYVFERRKQ